jgi:hypothetical protein
MTETAVVLTRTLQTDLTEQAARPGIDPAVPKLLARLREQNARYAKACWEGRRGYSAFLLTRMEATHRRIVDLIAASPLAQDSPDVDAPDNRPEEGAA